MRRPDWRLPRRQHPLRAPPRWLWPASRLAGHPTSVATLRALEHLSRIILAVLVVVAQTGAVATRPVTVGAIQVATLMANECKLCNLPDVAIPLEVLAKAARICIQLGFNWRWPASLAPSAIIIVVGLFIVMGLRIPRHSRIVVYPSESSWRL